MGVGHFQPVGGGAEDFGRQGAIGALQCLQNWQHDLAAGAVLGQGGIDARVMSAGKRCSHSHGARLSRIVARCAGRRAAIRAAAGAQ
jgi:hypothetical protein